MGIPLKPDCSIFWRNSPISGGFIGVPKIKLLKFNSLRVWHVIGIIPAKQTTF
jgi:hypothetical protein